MCDDRAVRSRGTAEGGKRLVAGAAGQRPVGEIPASVCFQAENMVALMPEPPSELPVELIRNERYCLLLTPVPTLNFVDSIRVGDEDVTATVNEIRELLRARNRFRAAWSIARDVRPSDLEEQLRVVGMVDYDEPPLEPSFAAMAIVERPSGVIPDGIEAREVRDHAELDTFVDVEHAAVEVSGRDSDAMRAAAHTILGLRQSGRHVMRFYIALRDGEPVGAARAMFLPHGINLSGGAVAPAARGQGVYRALVNARWNEAVAHDMPALTVQAGKMSRPILERLGFTTISTITVLRDDFA